MYAEVVNKQEAEQALKAWASIERDELVRAAHKAGISKNRIHTITGIARTTIDRILEPSMEQAQLTSLVAYLTRFTADWPRPVRFYSPPSIASAYRAEQLADELFADVEFKALKLGTFLGTPDGQLLTAALNALTPPPYREDLELLEDALRKAAQMQQTEAREVALRGVVVVAGLALAGALINSGSQG
jgi:hypothetical protein